MSTPDELRALVASVTLPEGWTLELHVQRVYRYRNFWALQAHLDGRLRRTFRAYNVRELLPHAVAWVEHEAAPLVVTTDAGGHITSIESAA